MRLARRQSVYRHLIRVTGTSLPAVRPCVVPLGPLSACLSTRSVALRSPLGVARPAPAHSCSLQTAAGPGPGSVEAEIARIHAAFVDGRDACFEQFEPSLDDQGVLHLDLGAKGQYSLQAHGAQLLLFSPISGPKYYDYDAANKWWAASDDGHLLDELLVRELMHITAVCLNL